MLKLAMASSGFSKLSGLALQALSIPLVYHWLGQREYELYLLLTALLATISLAQMGAGPGLVQGIAKANAAGDKQAEAAILGAAFRLAVLGSVIGGLIVLNIVYFVPPNSLFGPTFAHSRTEIVSVSNICVIILGLQFISGIVDSALAGYQEQVFSNVGQMAANLVSIAWLVVACKFAPSIPVVVMILYGAPALSRLINAVILFRRRPYLISRAFLTGTGHFPMLISIGAAFWLIQLSGVVEIQGGTYVLAHLSTTSETDLFSVVYRVIVLAAGVASILTQPLWPAFADAVAHRDLSWIKRSYSKIRKLLAVYSFCFGALIAFAGPWGFEHLMHIKTDGYRLLFVIFGVYFIANVWTHLYYITMMGMPGIWKVAATIISEKVAIVGLGIVLVPRLGAAGMALSYLLSSIVLPAWLLPIIMNDQLHRISSQAAPAAITGGNLGA